MKLPAKLLIKCLKKGTVFFYSNPDFEDEDSKHFHMILNHNPTVCDVFYLVCASSQIIKVDKRIAYRLVDEKTIIKIGSSRTDIFNKNTFFDCNRVFQLPKSVVIRGIDEEKITNKGPLSKKIYKQVREGVKNSRNVENKIKRELSLI